MKFLFQSLSILNLLDGFVTFIGLKLLLITELNPMMDKLYEIHPVLFMTVKIILSVLLYLFIFIKQIPKSSIVTSIASIALLLYTIVFGLHCYWVGNELMGTVLMLTKSVYNLCFVLIIEQKLSILE